MKYLIIGYYGHKNLGDEAILRSLVLHIFKNDAKAKITAFTSDIKNSKEANPDIKIRFLRLNKNLFRLIAQTVRANRIIFPGGHIITSNSIKIYAIYALLGKLFFNKVFLLPSGISPIKGGVNKVAAKLFYALLHTHATRDYNSQKVLKESVNIKTKVLPDITILLKKIENKNQFNSTVGINLRYYGKEKCLDYEKIITIIKNLNKTGNTDFVLFSSSVDESQNDYLIINEFVKTMKEIGFKYSIVYPKNVIELLDLLRKI